VLESPSLTLKLTSVLGAPVEKMIGRLPAFATGKINDATQLALRKCLNIALRTLGKPPAPMPSPTSRATCCTSSRSRRPARPAARSASSRCRSSCRSRPR
jgi:hypothetical protein